MIRPLKKIIRQGKIYFQQLPFLQAVKFLLADFFRKLFNFYSNFNYSQTGEQLIIESYVGNIENGFYLDIGCNEPVKLSNTFRLYCKGWKGVCIDANKDVISRFKKIRPNDIAYCTAISDVAEEKTFYRFKESAVGTLDDSLIDEWKENWHLASQQKMVTKTLNEVLEELQLQNQKIDLMSIDVEGFDLQVLRSINLTKYSPTLIVVELHKTNMQNLEANEVVQHLAKNNYQPVAFATMNGYFMKKKG